MTWWAYVVAIFTIYIIHYFCVTEGSSLVYYLLIIPSSAVFGKDDLVLSLTLRLT